VPAATLPPHPAPEPARTAARFSPPDRVDLRTAWTRERENAAAPGARHGADRHGAPCPRRHGWLLDDGLDVLLEPALADSTTPGYYPFGALDERVAAGLLERLDEAELAIERQNQGPTLGAVLRAVVRRPDRVRAQGYVVGPLRCDERISVTGVLLRAPWTGPVLERADVLRALADVGVDDMHAPPDEVTPWWGVFPPAGAAGGRDEPWFRVWWD